MPFTGQTHIRIARPSRDLAAAERFWADGLGLNVLYRAGAEREPGTHDLLMVGHPDGAPDRYLSCLRRTISAIQTGANGDVQPGGVG